MRCEQYYIKVGFQIFPPVALLTPS